MPNEIQRVEARLAIFEERIERRSEQRDAEIQSIRELLSEIVAGNRGLADQLNGITDRVKVLEAKKPPGPLAIWSPAIGTFTFLALVIGALVGPHIEALKKLEKKAEEVAEAIKELEKIDAAREERLLAFDKDLNRIDNGQEDNAKRLLSIQVEMGKNGKGCQFSERQENLSC